MEFIIDTMEKLLIIKIQNELEKIKKRYLTQYGIVIFDIKIKNLDGCIVLEGMVLSERQKKEAFLAAQQILKDIKIKNNIKVLGDPKEKLEIGWGIIGQSIVDIWSVFPDKKKLDESKRASQVVKSDIIRILAKRGSYYLAQTQDLAIGWAKVSQMSKVESRKSAKKWRNAKRAEFNKILKAKLTDKIRKKFIGFLQNYLYAPYIWGGTTELGIDCSGLTQKFYQEIFGILLPRNSRDQSECGKNISLEKAQFGDLIFLREKRKKYAHIGIIIDKFITLNAKRRTYDDILILNARRKKGGVVIESMEEILKNYKLISMSRLINC